MVGVACSGLAVLFRVAQMLMTRRGPVVYASDAQLRTAVSRENLILLCLGISALLLRTLGPVFGGIALYRKRCRRGLAIAAVVLGLGYWVIALIGFATGSG